MQESFLHFLWQYQLFNKADLRTEEGLAINIIRTGTYNTDAGPDFSEARILINGVEWIGQVELHVQASDWLLHKHQFNTSYDHVILHVVWQYDTTICRTDGSAIPTLALKELTDIGLLARYQTLTQTLMDIPCQSQLGQVPAIYFRQGLDKAIAKRLREKAEFVRNLLIVTGGDWEETTFQLLAQTMGMKVNAVPFFRLAQAVPLKIIRKHGDALAQIEALLFGQAGLLEGTFADAYPHRLQQEYQFLRHKYKLEHTQLKPLEWKWARLRPANFPSVRIAQLATLLYQNKTLFSAFIAVHSMKQAVDLLSVRPSDYWHQHYHFGKTSAAAHTILGKSSQENIVINTIIPLLVAYAIEKDELSFYQQAIQLLEAISPEDNRITRRWNSLGIKMTSAFESQASIELFNHYCTNRQCLQCPVGFYLLKKEREVIPSM